MSRATIARKQAAASEAADPRTVELLLRLWAWLSGDDARTVRHIEAWAKMHHVELSIRGRLVARGSGTTDLAALEDALSKTTVQR